MQKYYKYSFELKGEEIEVSAPNYQSAFRKAYKYFNKMGFCCTGFQY